MAGQDAYILIDLACRARPRAAKERIVTNMNLPSRTNHHATDDEAGFTLAELLVALFIFGLIASASVALLVVGVNGQQSSRAALDEMGAVRRLNTMIGNDVGQIAPRVTRDQAGVPQNAFFGSTGSDGTLLMSFVRRGWNNYDNAPRSSLQKVDYMLVDGTIERRIYPFVDGAAPAEPRILIEGVSEVSLRYRFGSEWRERWDPTNPLTLPSAIEMTAEIGDLGMVRQLFLASGES